MVNNMVNVITKKCSVTGKVIMGVGQDEFDKNWKAHLETLKIKKAIVKKAVIKEKEVVDFKEKAIKSNFIKKIKTLTESVKKTKKKNK